jgi:hypothetical protein
LLVLEKKKSRRCKKALTEATTGMIIGKQKYDEFRYQSREKFGTQAQYTEWLSGFATTRIRFILSDLVEDKLYAPKAAEGNFSFMRNNAAYSGVSSLPISVGSGLRSA